MHSYFTFNHILEIPAVVFGVLNVYLATRENSWNFFFGFLMCSIYFFLNLMVQLYAVMTLQFIFIGFQFYGFYQWHYGSPQQKPLQIRYASGYIRFAAVIVIILIAVIYSYLLKRYTNSTLVGFDVSVTAMSIVAQWMMSKKWVETWWLWIVIDIDSIVMYALKQLYFTTALYSLLLVIAILGAKAWQQRAKLAYAG